MAITEKSALARVLNISHELYSEIARNSSDGNYITMLDSVSAALSHCNSVKKPLRKCLRTLRRELRSDSKPFYLRVRNQFSLFFPTLEYDFDNAAKHLPALIYGNDMICSRLLAGEYDKAASMADAMKSYPGFLFGEFEALSDPQFYDLVFGYYPKLYEEPFMEEMKELFNK